MQSEPSYETKARFDVITKDTLRPEDVLAALALEGKGVVSVVPKRLVSFLTPNFGERERRSLTYDPLTQTTVDRSYISSKGGVTYDEIVREPTSVHELLVQGRLVQYDMNITRAQTIVRRGTDMYEVDCIDVWVPGKAATPGKSIRALTLRARHTLFDRDSVAQRIDHLSLELRASAPAGMLLDPAKTTIERFVRGE